ncbi:hypothetical protein SNE40_018321 [Patella caerulea]|uniref:Uncharacterized protein n=1 Tax=Patella caerulea TaxID=87958 RepID=A0AAN8PBB3_PATCE
MWITHQFTVSEECRRAGQRREKLENNEASTISQSKALIKCALIYLSEHVFDDETIRFITILRNLLDLETLSLKLKLRGSAMVAALDTQTFIDNSLKLVKNISEKSRDANCSKWARINPCRQGHSNGNE